MNTLIVKSAYPLVLGMPCFAKSASQTVFVGVPPTVDGMLKIDPVQFSPPAGIPAVISQNTASYSSSLILISDSNLQLCSTAPCPSTFYPKGDWTVEDVIRVKSSTLIAMDQSTLHNKQTDTHPPDSLSLSRARARARSLITNN